jgi:hypothetical protein
MAAAKAEKEKRNRFLMGFAGAALVAAVAGYFAYKYFDVQRQIGAMMEYKDKFTQADTKTFSSVTGKQFLFQGLMWGMTTDDIRKIYGTTSPSNDPDFTKSALIMQPQFKSPMPNANFMSLGLNNDKLYAVKMEFGDHEVFETQQVKQPYSGAILFGRFEGIYAVFKQLYGEPALVQYSAESLPLDEKLKAIKEGTVTSGANAGKTSNIYITWNIGDTKAEIAFFGYQGELHLTVRFLNGPVWTSIQKEQEMIQKQNPSLKMKLF